MGSGPSRLHLLRAVAMVSVCVLALVAGRGMLAVRSGAALLVLEPSGVRLPADGESTTQLLLRAPGGRLPLPQAIRVEIVEGARRAQVVSVQQEGGDVQFAVRAGVLPGAVVLEARAAGFAPARVQLATVEVESDRWQDGTPDFLRLTNEADRRAFHTWFTFLAEAQAFRPPGALPKEINDCAALIRFAFREALREHDGAWATEWNLEMIPTAGSVEKYQYPHTPLGAALFRVRGGYYRPGDAAHDAFAQFADAKTLWRFNTHFQSRDIRRARPGDLLFFRQLEQDLPFHAMIFLGHSQFEPGQDDWVVYHSGPIAGAAGEMRRVGLRELLEHPSPRWRPLAGNANFLGVYRWNILRGDE